MVSCVFLGNYHFSLYSNIFGIKLSVVFTNNFKISNTSVFIPDCLVLSQFYTLLFCSILPDIFYFIGLFEESSLILLTFSAVSLFSTSLIFSLDFIIKFLVRSLGFLCCHFSKFLNFKIHLFSSLFS